MSFLAGLQKALVPALEIGGGAAAVGGGIATGNPLLIGGGLSGIGTGLQTLDTKAHMNGLTDAQIQGVENSARRAGNARIEGQRRQAQQGVASNAAQGGTLNSGLYAGDAGRVNSQAIAEGQQLDASLAQNHLNALMRRTYSPQQGPVGILGRLASTTAMPITMLGAQRLASAGAPQVPGGPVGHIGPVNTGAGTGWQAPANYGAPAPDPGLGRYGAMSSMPSWAPEDMLSMPTEQPLPTTGPSATWNYDNFMGPVTRRARYDADPNFMGPTRMRY